MKRTIRRVFALLLCLCLGLELLPAGVLAATDVRYRFQADYVDTETDNAVFADYDGHTYVLGRARDGGGRVAVEANERFSARDEWGGERDYFEIMQSRGGALLRADALQGQWPWENTYAFSAGGTGLTVKGGALVSAEPGDVALYWDLYGDVNDEWVPALNAKVEGAAVYLVLRVGDGEPYFTASAVVDEDHIPSRAAARQPCVHALMEHHDGAAPTCTEEGRAEYWTCPACEAASRDWRFLDEKGALPFYNDSALSVPALGHVDADTDGFCDRCGIPMPIFIPVTEDAQIRSGLVYLLAAEAGEELRLLPEPDDSLPAWTLPATEAVTPTEEGALRYADVRTAGGLIFRLENSSEDGGKGGGKGGGKDGLEGGEYLYSMSFSGIRLDVDAGCGFQTYGSGYGWRVRLDEAGYAVVVPRMMEDFGPQFYLRAVPDAEQIWFSAIPAYDEYGQSLGLDPETEEYPVRLYIMSGQETENWSYNLSQGGTDVDYRPAGAAEASDPALAECEVLGLADAVTDRTARECVTQFRGETGSTEDSYTLTAFSTVTVTEYLAAHAETGKTLRLSIRHWLRVADGVNAPRTYELHAEQLSDNCTFTCTVWSWFRPAQLEAVLHSGEADDRMTYREEGLPLQVNLGTRAFSVEAESTYLVSFFTYGGEFLSGLEIRQNAILEEHAHQWGDLEWDSENEWRTCSLCGSRSDLTPHTYEKFAADSYAHWNSDTVFYTIQPTVTSPGTASIRCDHCGYRYEVPIDRSEWYWLILQDETGEPIPKSCLKSVMWFQHDAPYQDMQSHPNYYGDVSGQDPNAYLAWHYPQVLAGENRESSVSQIDANGKVSLYIEFKQTARETYVVPWTLYYDDLTPGRPVVVTLKNRERASITVTGRFTEAITEQFGSAAMSGRITTLLPNEDGGGYINMDSLWKDVRFSDDGSFSVTAPYGPTHLSISVSGLGKLAFDDVQLMERNESGVIDLGELHIDDRAGQEIFHTRPFSDEADGPGTVEALRYIADNGAFVLTDNETGESVLSKLVYIVPDASPDGLQLGIGFTNNLIVGHEVTLSSITDNAAYVFRPCTFTLQRRPGDGTTLDPEIFRQGHVTVSGNDRSILFDGEGNLVSQNFREGWLPAGDYTLIVYEYNPFVKSIDRIDGLELLGVPESCYLRLEFSVHDGDELSFAPEPPEFRVESSVSMNVTVAENVSTGEAVPIYISYKGLSDVWNSTLRFKVNGPLHAMKKLTDGRYTAWRGEGDLSEIVTSNAAYDTLSLALDANVPEGTICLLAEPLGGTLYVSCEAFGVGYATTSIGSVTVNLPSNHVTVEPPAPVAGYGTQFLSCFAKLPPDEGPYYGTVCVNGVPATGRRELNVQGSGHNYLPYTLAQYSGGSSRSAYLYEVSLEITREVTDEETGEVRDEFVWASDVYPVTRRPGGWPAPKSLHERMSAVAHYGDVTIDLTGQSPMPVRRFSFAPDIFGPNNTLNRDMVFDYQLAMTYAELVRNGQVLMEVYCCQDDQQPRVLTVPLKYNANTNTFDGTLVMEAGEYTLRDLPYGFSFVYSTTLMAEDYEVSAAQIEDRMERRLEKTRELEAITVPDAIDMDALEFILTNLDPEEYDEFTKDYIRFWAAGENAIHDAYAEFVEGLAAVELGEDGTTVADFGDVRHIAGLTNGEYTAETLNPSLTEEQLLMLGYRAVDVDGGGRWYFYTDSDNGSAEPRVSLVCWDEDPAERYELWCGLWSYLASAGYSGTVLRPAEGAKAALMGSEGEVPVLLQNLGRVTGTAALLDKVLKPMISLSVDLVKRLDFNASSERAVLAERQEFYGRMATEQAGKMIEAERKLVALRGEHFPEANLTEQAQITKLRESSKEYREVEAGLRDLEQSVREWAALRDAPPSATTRTVEYLRGQLEGAAKFLRSLRGFERVVRGVKYTACLAPWALGAAAVIADAITTVNYYQTCLRETLAIQQDLEWRFEQVGKMQDASHEPNLKDSLDAMRQAGACAGAWMDYRDEAEELARLYACLYNGKLVHAVACAGSTLAALATLNPVVMKADLALFGLGAVKEAKVAFQLRLQVDEVKEADEEFDDQCVDPLPFPKNDPEKDDKKQPIRRPREDEPERRIPYAALIDPSGYAYEAVASNRVEGVTAQIFYRDGGNEVLWEEAPLFGEVTTQITGADGRYEWMTPQGGWLVKLSKEGYLDADSRNDPAAVDGWLPVPPPQLDVNIPMISLASPAVEDVEIGADRVRVVFSQYMRESAAGAVSVTKDGAAATVAERVFADREESPTQPGVFYGRVLELRGDFAGYGYAVTVDASAENYAGRTLGETYRSGALTAASMPGELSHVYPNRFVTDVGDTEELVIFVRDTAGAPMAGVPVTVRQELGGTLSFAADTSESDGEGRAVFAVTGVASGYDTLSFTAGTLRTEMNTRVKPLSTQSPKKPAANLRDGQTVEAGAALVLSCDTEDVLIYYTTDDTCPCSESESRKLYTGPVPVTRTTLFRVAAWTEAGGYSERLNLRVYTEGVLPRVEREDRGIRVCDLPEDARALVGFYDEFGQQLRVEPVEAEDGSLSWTDDPAQVRVFFLNKNWAPLAPAWEG